jgi:uncharacterized damage-inducible protein DinB
MTTTDPRYPLGPFRLDLEPTPAKQRTWRAAIESLPAALRDALAGLDDARLDTPYREGGWTVRQLVHHLADSHVNAYVRLRLALTEDEPTIKPYEEARWAELHDARTLPVEVSVALLTALHERWAALLGTLQGEHYARLLRHPEQGLRNVDWLLQLYAWHGRHHVAHITALRKRQGWG